MDLQPTVEDSTKQLLLLWPCFYLGAREQIFESLNILSSLKQLYKAKSKTTNFLLTRYLHIMQLFSYENNPKMKAVSGFIS